MGNITRRNFLKLSFTALAGLSLVNLMACSSQDKYMKIAKDFNASSTTGSSKDTTSSSKTEVQNNSADTSSSSSTINAAGSKAPVGIAAGNDKVSVLVGKAVELAGGLGFINSGSTVLIKPNINTGDPHPASTNPEVLYEVIKLVKNRDPYRILVGDRSGFWLNTISCMKKSKIYDAAIDAGAEVYPFDDEEWITFNSKSALNWSSGFRIPKIINDVDHIISIPVLKTHSIADFSIAIKNWVGILHPKDRVSGLHKFSGDRNVFGYKLAELHLSRLPSFIITDCTRVFVDGGPSSGKTVDCNLVYASSDIIANDVVGLSILKTLGTIDIIQDNSPWDHPQIRRAVELGLGIKDCRNIEINSYGRVDLDSILKNIT